VRGAWKGMQASLLLHALVIGGVWASGLATAPARTPLVIDLTIGGPWGDEVSPAPSPAWGHPRPEAPGRHEIPPAPPAAPLALLPPPSESVPEVRPVPPAATVTPETTSSAAVGPEPQGASPVASIPAPREGRSAPVGGSGAPRAAGIPAPSPAQEVPVVTAIARATPGTGAGGEGPAEAGAKARSRYPERDFAYIRDVIQRGIAYPPTARKMGWEGKVVVAFLVLADGSVRDVRVVQGSGHAVLDRGAVDAVRSASPFPRPPAEAEIITPVVYRLE